MQMRKSRSPHRREEILAKDLGTRQTGLGPLEELPWGAHICLFYETKEDLLDTNVGYFKAGLEKNEFCIWAISEPIAEEDARNALKEGIPDFERHAAGGRMEVLPGYDWYLKGGRFDSKTIIAGWFAKMQSALAMGLDGIRVSGNAFWLETSQWKKFSQYEEELDQTLAGQPMIALCTYPLNATRSADILDAARAHQFTIARRRGDWEFLETPEFKKAKQEIEKLDEALGALSRPFPGYGQLTPRERVVLAHTLAGASSKDASRTLNVSPRTIEFHRAQIMRKLGARNLMDLARIVFGHENST